MKSLVNVAVIMLSAASLLGCGTTVLYSNTNAPPRPLTTRAPQSVHVFTTGGPARPYAEIGIIQARQDSPASFDEMPDIIAEMRAEAGRRGCDGLVITGRADETTGNIFGNQNGVYGGSQTSEGFMGTCIVYVDPPVQGAPPTVATSGP